MSGATWEAVEMEGGYWILQRGGRRMMVPTEGEVRLMAAAPDLLEALKGELAPGRTDCNERKCGACARCRSHAAIAKAEGR